jgi:sugar phosphate isomerase/epimerase
MRLSCDPILFFRDLVLDRTMSLEDWFDLARELRLDGTELQHNCLEGYEPAYLDGVHEALTVRGLAVSQVIGSAVFSHPGADVRRREVAVTRQQIDAAARFGAPCVRLTAGQAHPEVDRATGVRRVVEAFRECLAYAAGRGVLLAYENHYKDFFRERPDFSQQHDVYLEIFDRLRGEGLKANFDCANPIMIGADPVALLRRVAPDVVHVHCTDRPVRFEYTHVPAGEGLVDYPSVFALLQDAGYDGWLSVEYNGTEGVAGLRRAFDFVRRTWAAVTGERAAQRTGPKQEAHP